MTERGLGSHSCLHVVVLICNAQLALSLSDSGEPLLEQVLGDGRSDDQAFLVHLTTVWPRSHAGTSNLTTGTVSVHYLYKEG